MAIVPMQKIGILAHAPLREEVISLLHEEGVMEIRPAAEKIEVDHTEVAFKEAELQFAITTLENFASKETIAACAKPIRVEDVLHASRNTDVAGIVEELHALERSDTEANTLLQEIQERKERITPWKTVHSPIQADEESENTTFLIGTIPEEHVPLFRDTMIQSFPRSIVEILESHNGETSMMVYLWKQYLPTFEQSATELGWTQATLPVMTHSPAEEYEECLMEEKRLHLKLQENRGQRRKLSVELPRLKEVQIFMQWLDQKQEVRESIAQTHSTIMLLGWMPKTMVDRLESKLQKISPAIAVLRIKADENEEVPVLLKNATLITPFQSVTTLYGLPLPSEMDPTAALSPFFALFFGLCLTDAGYGAVIALIFGIYLLKTRQNIQEAPLWWLLFISGIVTILVSIPFGGWFGLMPDQVPEIFTKQTDNGLMFKGQIWNLNEQQGITFLQYLSLALGLTHIFFGVFLAGLHRWLHGKKAEAFWKSFTSHILLGSVFFYIFAPEELATTAYYTLIGAGILMVWGQGYGSPLHVRPIMGMLGVVNFGIGLLSNGLSYLRILALGLVTGAIALAVNQVAIELGNLFPLWVGIPVTLLIAVMGHTVSIALNTLGSFIHSGRLQFIEFFSQFFEGGGRAFSPFKRSI